MKKAAAYLDQGAEAWNATAKCVTCHTNGSYMAYRPALTDQLGSPSPEAREFFTRTLRQQMAMPRPELLRELGPTQVVYIACGLAQWDAHVSHTLSTETRQALELMFDIQESNGACMHPATAGHRLNPIPIKALQWLLWRSPRPLVGWQASTRANTLRVERLKHYLRTEPPPHDYGRVFLLWAASALPDLLSIEAKRHLVDLLWKQQRPDGGWSIRTFAAPEQWGAGKRANKLRSEPEFRDPPSDGHQTGLVVTALRAAGVPKQDTRIQRGIAWLLKNQRASGRWWTRSLNTDEWHFIYSGTCYALLALASCDAIPHPAP